MATPPRKIRQLPAAQAPSDSDVFPVSQMNTETGIATTRAMTRQQLQSDLIKVINEARQEFVNTANEEHAQIHEQLNFLQQKMEENETTDSNIQTAIAMVQQMIAEGDGGKSAYQLWLELPGNSGKTVQQYFDAMSGPPGTTDWNGITNKPASYPPISHSHPIADIVGVQAALDGKASKVHTHNEGEIVGLSASLDEIQQQVNAATQPPTWSSVTGKPETFPPTSHNHQVSQVVGLQAALDGKVSSVSWADVQSKPSTFTPSAHNHAISDVAGLQTALDSKTSLRVARFTATTNAQGVATFTFSPAFSVPPDCDVIEAWNGEQMLTGAIVPGSVTTTGCQAQVMVSRGTLLLNSGPFQKAAANVSITVRAIGR